MSFDTFKDGLETATDYGKSIITTVITFNPIFMVGYSLIIAVLLILNDPSIAAQPLSFVIETVKQAIFLFVMIIVTIADLIVNFVLSLLFQLLNIVMSLLFLLINFLVRLIEFILNLILWLAWAIAFMLTLILSVVLQIAAGILNGVVNIFTAILQFIIDTVILGVISALVNSLPVFEIKELNIKLDVAQPVRDALLAIKFAKISIFKEVDGKLMGNFVASVSENYLPEISLDINLAELVGPPQSVVFDSKINLVWNSQKFVRIELVETAARFLRNVGLYPDLFDPLKDYYDSLK
jgi:hypothetical protein